MQREAPGLLMKALQKLAISGLAWAVALSMSLPIFWMALTAFKTEIDANQFPPKFLFMPTLENFTAVSDAIPLLRSLLNSVVVSSGATALCFLFAFPAAYGLAFHGGMWRTRVLLSMLATRFMPGMGIMMPMYLIFTALGLMDTRIGLILIYAVLNLPIVVWLFYFYMREIPREILESARLDGATVKQQLLHLLLPLCLPGVCSTALLSIVLCWNESFWSIQMTSSAGVPVSAYIASMSGDLLLPQLSAASLLAIGPILLVGLLTQRTFVRGLTFGAVQ